jgi:hypothetical protein
LVFQSVQLLAEQTKKPDKRTIGIDGTTYYFATTTKSGEMKIGETWSPNKKHVETACESLR